MKRIGFTLLLAVVAGATPQANAQVSAQSSGQTCLMNVQAHDIGPTLATGWVTVQ